MKRFNCFLVFVLSLWSSCAFSTHIRAADFSSTKITPTLYDVTLTVYTDFTTVLDGVGVIPIETVEIGLIVGNPGEQVITNTFEVARTSLEIFEPGRTFKNTFSFRYSVPSTNAIYRLAFNGNARNDGIKNIDDSGTANVFIEEFFFADALDDDNSSPVFTEPPLFNGATNRVYTYNPGGIDPDGDSLSYEIIPIRNFKGDVLSGYRSPDDPSFGSGSVFEIDPLTGQVTWDTPLQPGEYNVAIQINEYRNGIRIGYVIRDQQILIEDSDNEPPVLFLPQDTCISAGDVYREKFTTSDPNGDVVVADISGILESDGASFSSFTPNSSRPDSTVNSITWSPSCSNIGQFPVYGLAQAEDDFPDFPLSSSGTWEIKVNGAAPELNSALIIDSGIELSWDSYDCQKPRSVIDIYRIECDTSNVIRSSCTVGISSEWGAVKIGEVDVSQTSFTDDGTIGGLTPGIEYYYLIAVRFGSPNFGESYASNIVSSSFGENLPLITASSYDKTSQDKFVTISWQHFDSFDSSTYVKPYTYNVISNGVIVSQFLTDFVSSGSLSLDTLSFDTELPLQLELIDSGNNKVGSLDFSLDKLNASGGDESLFLNWQNLNSWSYPDSLFSHVYIFKLGEDTTLIDSLRNGVLDYQVLGLQNGDTVCSYLEIPGTYCEGGSNLVYRNFTNTSCSLVQDMEPPCIPVLEIELIQCDNPSEGNTLQWELGEPELGEGGCNNEDLAVFNLQVKPVTEGAYLDLEAFGFDTLNHEHLEGGQLYCYRIQAIDSSGNISEFSEVVCQDFCGEIIYPNVFSPNGDGVNDELLPMSTFEGLKNPLLTVFNRWGQLIFSTADPENNPWTGYHSSGKQASQGVYYIEVTAEKELGTPGDVVYKGWVQLLR